MAALRQYHAIRRDALSFGAQNGEEDRKPLTVERTTTHGDHVQELVFDENDPFNPQTWSQVTKWRVTITVSSIGFIVGLASSINSAAAQQAVEKLHVSEEAFSLVTGLYLVGFGAGALFAGPISETQGRNFVYIGSMVLFCCFVLGSALCNTFGGVLAFRFLSGFFGAAPLTCAGGTVSDVWSPQQRTFVFPAFACAGFLGPGIGPVIGGFVGQHIDYKYCDWITLIIAGAILLSLILFQPETYAPVLLKWRAATLRKSLGDNKYKSPLELRDISFIQRTLRALYRPFLYLVLEPIVALISLYMTIIYVVLFTFLEGYDFIYSDLHGLSPQVVGLCFLGIDLGLVFCVASVPLVYWRYEKLRRRENDKGNAKVKPEARLFYAMIGGWTIPVSLFWMGWTSMPQISFWSPLVASTLFAFGLLCVFISSYQYIIDAYEEFAASALATLTVVRYLVSGGMVVVARPMYMNLGVPKAVTILACLSAAMVPVPFVFAWKGEQIRKWSHFSPSH